jgi:4-hydroxy-3-methylbut-2-en-1-yl diphosphate reductase
MKQLLLANPRGFCAGVDRAILIVEEALRLFGAPVYVRHEIVHNRFVVETLKEKGAVFVKDLHEIPDNAITVFSAHGVSDAVENTARLRGLPVLDATCPLVTKVHAQARRVEDEGREVILIGHKGHPEVEGTAGRVKNGVILVETVADVATIQVKNPEKLAYVTQTTLSVRDTAAIIEALQQRFPSIIGPGVADICYATQNRQDAVLELAKTCEVIIVVGAKNSSNSNRLRDLAIEAGRESYLVDTASDLRPEWFYDKYTIGLTAGASAPEILIEGVANWIETNTKAVRTIATGIDENVHFNLPKPLKRARRAQLQAVENIREYAFASKAEEE